MFAVRRKVFGLGKQDFCVDSPTKEIKDANPEMLCQTRIVLGDEYPVMGYPTPAMADETRSLYAHRRSVLGISRTLYLYGHGAAVSLPAEAFI